MGHVEKYRRACFSEFKVLMSMRHCSLLEGLATVSQRQI